jgi:hypothetical protein
VVGTSVAAAVPLQQGSAGTAFGTCKVYAFSSASGLAEGGVYTVVAESRTQSIDEGRVYDVAVEDRLYDVTIEDRLLELAA